MARNIEQDINNAMIRADEIILAKEISDTSATNRLEGTVIDIIHRRGIIEIHIESKHIFNVFITTRSLHEMDIKIGDSINMFFKGSAGAPLLGSRNHKFSATKCFTILLMLYYSAQE